MVFIDRESENKYQNIIQNNIDKVTALAFAEQKGLKDKVTNTNLENFDIYSNSSRFPYFVFKGDSLVYWSSNIYVPSSEILNRRSAVSFSEYNRNFGLFVKTNFSKQGSTYTIVSIINLYRYISQESGLGKSGFDFQIFYTIPSTISQTSFKGTFPIKGADNETLFYIKPVKNPQNLTLTASKGTLGLFSTGILLITIFCILQISYLRKNHRYLLASVNLVLLMSFVRLWMQLLGLPWLFFSESSIPEYLVDSEGFGDLLISMFFVLITVGVLSLWQLKAIATTKFNHITVYSKSVFAVSLVLTAIVLSLICYAVIIHVYDNDFIGMHYSLRFYLANFRLTSYLTLFSAFGIYFLTLHLLINLYSVLMPKVRSGFLHWLYGTILGVFVVYYFRLDYWVVLVTTFYFLIVYLLRLPRFFYILRFKTFVYFLLGAFAFTLVLYHVVNSHESAKNLADKREFATKLLLQKDLKAEILLNQFNESAHVDSNLAKAIQRPVFAYESLRYFIKDSLLNNYFDHYDVDVYAFTPTYVPLNPDSDLALNELHKLYALPSNKTEFQNLYFVKGYNQPNFYLLFSEVLKGNEVLGMIVLKVAYNDVDLVQSAKNQSYQEIKMDPALSQYSYALYDPSKKLIYEQGNYKYSSDFDKSVLEMGNLEERTILGAGHYMKKDSIGRVAIVTQKTDFYWDTLSNFSYLFLISLLGIVFMLMILGVLSGFKSYRLSFSSKIQFYLNLAFLVPLTFIILLTLGVVINSFINIQNRSLIENSTNVFNTINLHYINYQSGRSTKGFFEEQLNNLAKSSDFDLNIYNNSGKLSYTSTIGQYQSKQRSQYINPEAFSKIVTKGEREQLIDETLGNLDYKTVYLKGMDNARYDIVGVSYPDADIALERQIKEVVSTILIIFFIMFVMLLAMSYTASTNLTAPLRLVAQKLKKTNFNAQNEEIVWKSNDEIGLLTSEYNRMIKKLEESKEALSASEKQTAWREMAKQVAHEIKNPLTPMKLSIQQLQRTLPLDNPELKVKMERALSSINEQIDNISEIANSFSEFAKMPVPRTEVFDLVSTVQKTVDLYSQNNNIKIDFEKDALEILVTGDRMILSRAVTNLILNGLQSVPPKRKPIIMVSVQDKGDMGLIEVKDNGAGISDELRKKVFIPNFSTKVGGSGLGLSMAKRGIEHAGGNIWFESVEEEGTSFYLDLPKVKN